MSLPTDPAKRARLLAAMADLPDAVAEWLEAELREADEANRSAKGEALGWSQGKAQVLADMLKTREEARKMRTAGKLPG
jgi:hypothetical protein